jgi:hypothetical protein
MGELNISSAKIAPEFRSTLLSCNALRPVHVVIMVSTLHLSVFLLIATLAATPSYYVMRRTSEGRARESISYLLGLAA